LKFIIEVDGPIHSSPQNQELDEMRQRSLEDLGIKVLRFTNEEVTNKIEIVLAKIDGFIKSKMLLSTR
jgi:very-short-patch-repair endonuclease